MKIGVFKVLLALLSASNPSHVDASCEISLQDDLPTKEPLYLKRINSHLEFVVPPEDNAFSEKDASVFKLADREELILACPGKLNFLIGLPTSVIESHCLKDTKFFIGNRNTVNIIQLRCSRNVRAVLRPDFLKPCGATGTEMFIGFEVLDDGFLPLIRVCHDVLTANTLYVEHEILATIRGAKIVRDRPDFLIGPPPLYNGVDLKNVYSQEYQRKLFDELLGEGEGQRLIQGTYFLARGHLAPNADFLYGTWRWATFFYANAAPQWQIINGGYWKFLEQYIRRLTDMMGEDLHVITGTSGVLTLKSVKTGRRTAIFLQPSGRKKIPVPSLFFKIIHSRRNNAAIVAICSNNPFEKSSLHKLCRDIAAANRWPSPDRWTDFAKGQIIFCDVDQFRARIKEELPTIDYSSILQGMEK